MLLLESMLLREIEKRQRHDKQVDSCAVSLYNNHNSSVRKSNEGG